MAAGVRIEYGSHVNTIKELKMFTSIFIGIMVSLCIAAFCYVFTSSGLGEVIMVASLYIAVFGAVFLVLALPIASIIGGPLP